MRRNSFIILVVSLFSFLTLSGQSRSEVFGNYIRKYSRIAVEHQKRYGVPASITLAQGLLESSGGRSELARKGNNHFGIKCGNGWVGETIRWDDDQKNECFRKYNSPEQSFEDHSHFLTTQPRYTFLLNLNKTDYKAWAYGLKKAGYATDKKYAQKLIRIIQDFELYKFDEEKPVEYRDVNIVENNKNYKWNESIPDLLTVHNVFRNNGVKCILTESGDTFDSIAYEFGIKKRKLLYYNDLAEEMELAPKTVVYIRKKKTETKKENPMYHKVKKGDSMYKIAQKYGIRLKSLYELNDLSYAYIPEIGHILNLR